MILLDPINNNYKMKIKDYKQITLCGKEDLNKSIEENWMIFSSDYTRLLAIYNKNALIFRIPDGVKIICDNVFKSCAANIIELPSTLEVIGRNAFFELKRFKSEDVTLPSNVKYIADEAFVGAIPVIIITSKLLYLGKKNCQKARFIVVVDEYLEHTKNLRPEDSDKIVSLSYYNDYKKAESKREEFASKLKLKLQSTKLERATPTIYKQYVKLGEDMKEMWPMEAMIISFKREFILKSHTWKYSVVKGKNGKGLKSCSGKTVIDEKYDKIICNGNFFKPSRVIAERKDKVDLYYINGDEIEVLIPDLDKISIFDKLVRSNDLIILEKDNKFGIVFSRKLFLPLEYDMIIPNKYGFSVCKNGLWGYLFAGNKYYLTWSIPIKFEAVEVLSSYDEWRYVYCIKKDNRYRIVEGEFKSNKDKNEVYDEVVSIQGDRRFKIRIGDKWGIADNKGMILEPQYEDIIKSNDFSRELYFVKDKGLWGTLLRKSGFMLHGF